MTFERNVHELMAEAQLILDTRTKQYGDPSAMLGTIGRVWGALLEREPLSARQVALLMASLKIVREATGAHQRDNSLDALSYISIAEVVGD